MLKAKKLIVAAIGTLMIVGVLAGFLTQGGMESRNANVLTSTPNSGAALAAPLETPTPTTDFLSPDELGDQYYSDQQGQFYSSRRDREHREREYHHEREHEEDDD